MWQMRYGLGGGFGGCKNKDWEDLPGVDKEEQANEIAYEAACEEYESYEGLHGLRTISEIAEEDGVSADEAEEI